MTEDQRIELDNIFKRLREMAEQNRWTIGIVLETGTETHILPYGNVSTLVGLGFRLGITALFPAKEDEETETP